MIGFLLANGQNFHWQDGDLWYAIPLIIAVSLVYSATRHERMQPILIHAGRVAIGIIGFMAIAFVVLTMVSWCI